MKNEVMVKARQNRGEKTKSQPFSHNTSCYAKFSHNTPLMRKCFCGNFQKNMLSVPSQNPLCEFHRNANHMPTICEFVFETNLQNHALCLGTHRNAKFLHNIRVMRNLHFLFKDRVLLFPCSISSSILTAPLFQSPNPFLKFLFFIIPHSQHHHGSPSP